MMCGLQGAGKTTHAGKLAGMYKKQGKRPLLVACDVYRPAAIKQLQIVGGQLDIPVFEMGTDVSPVKIAEEGLKYANLKGYDMPESGGMGTHWHMIGGLAMILAALMYGYSLRRKRERGASR
jgi:signal recognition particle GTPase